MTVGLFVVHLRNTHGIPMKGPILKGLSLTSKIRECIYININLK